MSILCISCLHFPSGTDRTEFYIIQVPILPSQIQKQIATTTSISNFNFLFVQWLDWMGTLRTRCIPVQEQNQESQFRFGISRGNLGTLQNDSSTPVCNPIGQIYVRPDLSSLKPMYHRDLPGRAATLMAGFEEENGRSVDLCPRSLLKQTLETMKDELSLDFLVGFEIEITFCRRAGDDSDIDFRPLDTNHAWSTFTDEQFTGSFILVTTVVQVLQDIGISVQQAHSESGAGQYEFVLKPLPPLEAVDTLVQAKQCIQQLAASHGLRATCHPQPFPGIGTACHANISFNTTKNAQDLEKWQMSFMAFVCAHLPSICAFTMPQAVSYARVADDSWTTGSWVAWGTQNRETPLRRTATPDGKSARWEVRFLDGTANVYLALYVIMRVGLQGIREETEMALKDCQRKSTFRTLMTRSALTTLQTIPPSSMSRGIPNIALHVGCRQRWSKAWRHSAMMQACRVLLDRMCATITLL